MRRGHRVLIGIVIHSVGVLNLCEPSTAIILRTSTTLFVAEVLASSGSEKSCETNYLFGTLSAGLATHRRALRSPRFVSSSMDCRDVGNLLRVLPVDHCQCGKAMHD